MRLFFGILLGLVIAAGIAFGAGYYAFGNLADIGERDKSKDITKTYDLNGFDEIDIGGVYEMDVRVGGDYSVKISGAPEEFEKIKVSVTNGILKLDHESHTRTLRGVRNMGLTAEITTPALRAIDVSGVAEVDVTGVSADDFSARLSGVGELDIAGTCGALTARVSGVGELDAEELKCASVDVRVSGIGEADVYASESADATVSGIGSVTIHGSPSQVQKDKNFLADIRVK